MGRQIESDFGGTKKHPRHPDHRMRLKSDEEKPFKCGGCRELGSGPRYQCVENNCDFVLHQLCFEARPQDLPKKHRFTGNWKFQFRWTPPADPNGRQRPSRLCHACERDVQGFLYYGVKSSHRLYLHPWCKNLPITISDDVDASRVKLILKDKVPSNNSKCGKCEKTKDLKVGTNNNKGSLRSGWFYLSSSGNYCYHVHCVMEFIQYSWEGGYFNKVTSSSSDNYSSSTSRGRSLVRDHESARSSRNRSVESDHRSSITSASDTGSSALAKRRRGWSLPPIPSPARKFFIKLGKRSLCYLTAKLLAPEDPISLFKALSQVMGI